MTDLLRGAEPEAIVQSVVEGVAHCAPALVVCSVPEVTKRGKEVQARAMLLNAKLKNACASLNAIFVDLSTVLEGERRTARDGIHYLAVTARQGAARVLQLSRPFLGGKERTPNRHPKPDKAQPQGPNDDKTALEAQNPPVSSAPGPTAPNAAAPTVFEETEVQANAWAKSVPGSPPFVPGSPHRLPWTFGGSPLRPPYPPPPNPNPQIAHVPILTPPLPWPWGLQQVLPAVHSAVGEMVRQHLLMATRLPQ